MGVEKNGMRKHLTRSFAWVHLIAGWRCAKSAHVQLGQQQVGQRLIRREGREPENHIWVVPWVSGERGRRSEQSLDDPWTLHDVPTTASNNTNFTQWREEYAQNLKKEQLDDDWKILVKNALYTAMLVVVGTVCLILWGYIGYRILRGHEASEDDISHNPKSTVVFRKTVESFDTYTCRPEGAYNELPCPADVDELQAYLDEAGIDTTEWGSGRYQSVEDLFGQLLRQECALEFDGEEEVVEKDNVGGDKLVEPDLDSSDSDDSDGSSKKNKKKRRIKVHALRRSVTVVTVELNATFDDGDKTLMCVSITDEISGLVKTDRLRVPTKKIAAYENAEEQVPGLLFTELQLPIDWQKTHLLQTGEESQSYEGGDKYGVSFPGLSSFFTNTMVFMHVKDIDAQDVAGRIGLPSGADFKVADDQMLTSKTRSWVWKRAEEIPEGENAMFRGGRSRARSSSILQDNAALRTMSLRKSKTGAIAVVDERDREQEEAEAELSEDDK